MATKQAKTILPQVVFTPRQVTILTEMLTNQAMAIGDAINDPAQADLLKDLQAEYAEIESLLKSINNLRFIRVSAKQS
jgi:hypothetical protein